MESKVQGNLNLEPVDDTPRTTKLTVMSTTRSEVPPLDSDSESYARACRQSTHTTQGKSLILYYRYAARALAMQLPL